MNTVQADITAKQDPAPLAALQADNDSYLQQLAELVATMPPAIYRSHDGHNDAIGAHVRHVLEHYESLLRDADSAIDYARRDRDPDLETNSALAHRRIERVRARLAELVRDGHDRDLPVMHHHEVAPGQTAAVELQSSLGRELQFLLSHTVHHLALIAVLARQRDVAVPPTLGLAPSTLRHRER